MISQNEPQLSAEMEKRYSVIMLAWIKTQWKLEEAHQNGEPYTRMKFEAQSAKIEADLKHFLATALEEQFRRILFIVYNYHLPEVEYYLKEIRDNMNKDSQEEINEWYEKMIKFGDEE